MDVRGMGSALSMKVASPIDLKIHLGPASSVGKLLSRNFLKSMEITRLILSSRKALRCGMVFMDVQLT